MAADKTEVDVQACSGQIEQSVGGMMDVQGGPSLTWGSHGHGGPGSSWVKPWLKTANSSTCPHHCDGFELWMI